ncbi:hypothetical protein PL71_15050 [Pseudoalteromonas distincta]|uniref:Orphan protein n=1 Tax=Pseudoalteromonas distincta TaxID=77608 RepID=A0ABT9GBZ1_9GAMM|nr:MULTISPECIES: hypothetical protein [Pseudoalteromonas distincta group]KHM46191.1 hypothetical protein PL71_15050 [Pseudoalteromonas elyakovii]KID37014.1 hypothetical protein QT16_13415 [Pseudoalteromonas distincta]MDP4483368.1 hypothetical protein [Pseudoalteromonas elyakovii]
MSWLDTFKNDERSLYWLVEYIHHTELFQVSQPPKNIKEARYIIQCWENESINETGWRLKYELRKLMKSYFANMLPIESFNWLSDSEPKQLCWVFFYLKFNPPKRYYYALPNKYFRDFACNVKEIYPLIIRIFDATLCSEGVKQDYLLTMKQSYSQFVTGKSRLPWLDIKDEETCSWVWRYLTEKIDTAIEQKDTINFIKPIDNETIYWSVIALISNWKFLNGHYLERFVAPLTSITLVSKFFSKKKVPNHNNTVNITTRNVPFLDLNTENNSEVTNKAPFLELYSHYLELKNEGKATLKKASLESLNYDQYAHYKVNPYPNSAIMGYVERKYNGIRFTIGSINIYPDVPLHSNTLKINRVFVSLKRDKLSTTDELTTSLYNAHKQKILRQKNNSSFGLTKANQKKLASYAKKLNTTEKKALNKIISDYKPLY